MNGPNVVGRLRALRRRKGWSQKVLAVRLGTSQQTISRLEGGDLRRCSLDFLDRWTAVLGGYLVVDLRINGQPPLADARHAALQEWLVRLLARFGWNVTAEVSFNHYGDRGRVDVLAYQPLLSILVIFEIKTRLADVQDTLGRLDIKVRLADEIARQQGWAPTSVVSAFLLRDQTTIRRRVRTHAALFGRFALRSTDARQWLRMPTLPPPSGILMYQTDPGPEPRIGASHPRAG